MLLSTLGTPLHVAYGQPNIAADLPGIGSVSYVLAHGVIQLEAGTQFAAIGAVDLYSLGQIVLRLGVPAIELHALLNSWVIQRSALQDGEGFQDLGVGIKARLWKSAAGDMALSALGTVILPVGSDLFTSDELIPAITLLADYSVSSRWALSMNAGYAAGPGAVESVYFLNVTPGVSLLADANLGAYFGYAGFYSAAFDQNFLEAGFTWGATDELGFHALEPGHYVTDLHATVLHLLGLDSKRLDIPGRKRLDVDYGKPIQQIFV